MNAHARSLFITVGSMLLSLFASLVLVSCMGASKPTQPTGGGPETTPAVYYQGKLYVERYANPMDGTRSLRYEEVGAVVATVSDEWPAEELYASALEVGTVVYRGVRPYDDTSDGYLYIKKGDSYIQLYTE